MTRHDADDRWPAHIPRRPAHPERICWGCDQLCPVNDMRCGSEVVRAMHPIEWEPRDKEHANPM